MPEWNEGAEWYSTVPCGIVVGPYHRTAIATHAAEHEFNCANCQRHGFRPSPRDTLIAYLKAKTEEGDWHAVSDAANDLRVLEAKAGR